MSKKISENQIEPYWQDGGLIIYQGHVLDILDDLEKNSIQTCITSPPYWGLRDYGEETATIWDGDKNCEHEWGSEIPPRGHKSGKHGPNSDIGAKEAQHSVRESKSSNFCQKCGAWRGQLGLEPTPDLYISHLVQIFRKVRKVLREDGTLWIVIGDSYSSKPKFNYDDKAHGLQSKNYGTGDTKLGYKQQAGKFKKLKAESNLKPKDLIGIPWMLAFALRDDGWWLRSDIIWVKGNPMPESVKDRCTTSHEYVFMLAKSQQYYYDQDAIREPHQSKDDLKRRNNLDNKGNFGGVRFDLGRSRDEYFHPKGRNKRDVWTVNTKPFPQAHFAVFPPELIEPMIKAGTSKRGCCPKCGAPWERVSEKTYIPTRPGNNTGTGKSGSISDPNQSLHNSEISKRRMKIKYETMGWKPTCDCYPRTDEWQRYPRQEKDESDEEYEERIKPMRKKRQELLKFWESEETDSCILLDPFVGSGTTLKVAEWLGRQAIGIEISKKYCDMAVERLRERVLI